MLKVENIEVNGFEAAIRGMRNPMNSWDRSDSVFCDEEGCCVCKYTCRDNDHVEWKEAELGYCVGCNDMKLMQQLFRAGTEHRKYMRMITVTMDVTAPLYWWKEFDTYKVGTVANSCSTMHKIHAKRFTEEDFSMEHLEPEYAVPTMRNTIMALNMFREQYRAHKRKEDWLQMIQLLPSSYNQMRTVMMNYEVAFNIMKQRSAHKLNEWHVLVDELKHLPFMLDIVEG